MAHGKLSGCCEDTTYCSLGRSTLNVQVFLNVVLDEAYEEKTSGQRIPIGTVVIRGNSVVMIEALEKL